MSTIDRIETKWVTHKRGLYEALSSLAKAAPKRF
jgi:hypothetical protein